MMIGVVCFYNFSKESIIFLFLGRAKESNKVIFWAIKKVNRSKLSLVRPNFGFGWALNPLYP